MKIFTIGFTQKSAQQFFELLRQNQIQRLVDIRLRPQGQLAGFARQGDLPYFLEHLADGCRYVHLPMLAPTTEILDSYRAGKNWTLYVERFEALMDERDIPAALDREAFERWTSCLLCSEATPKQCHRRLVAERLATHWSGVEIVHL
ncbi:MAG: DUF488 domain-containing protein [Anaerolineales bacterium]|nr:DUF488 domain-containing protein [Anaerolineales bacterium]